MVSRCFLTNNDTFMRSCSPNFPRIRFRLCYASLAVFRREGHTGKVHAVDAETSGTGTQVAETNQSICYTVKEGDTLTFIANKFKTSVDAIVLANQIADPDYVPAGKVLEIHNQSRILNEVTGMADEMGSASFHVKSKLRAQSKIYREMGSSLLMPMLASPFSGQLFFVKAASCLLIFLLVSALFKKFCSDLETKIHTEVLRRQSEKAAHDTNHRPKVRRWQGILDDDRVMEEADHETMLATDRQAQEETEEEKLRQSYAQLESAYARFLVDSGLSKSGYWRGGVPPTKEE